MNIYDSQRMADALTSSGYTAASEQEDADILIFNSCSIRSKADEKLFSDLGRARQNTTKVPVIVVTGCVAQLQHEEIMRRAPFVNIILGPQDIHHLLHYLSMPHDKCLVSVSLDATKKFACLPDNFSSRTISEFLTIQEGCNKCCTYCVVPYTRGREFSRSVKEIVSELRKLIDHGVKEVTLLGQNVNSYIDEDSNTDFAGLLETIATTPGLLRLRYTTSHPKHITEALARAHRDIPVLMPFIHLPVQSGSDIILKRMNRHYDRAEYLDKVAMLREYRPDIAFSSDFIVGFPGETDENFQDTISLVNEVKFAQAYSFKYSPRPRTGAALMPNQIDEDVKSERLQTLQTLLENQQKEYNAQFIGRQVEVLILKPGRYDNQLVGRTPYGQAITIESKDLSIGDVCTATVVNVEPHSLMGQI